MLKNNIISCITGVVVSTPYIKKIPEDVLCFDVAVQRKSGKVDKVNIVTTDLLCTIKQGDSIRVTGFLYTYQNCGNSYPRFQVCLYSVGLVKTEYSTNKNVIIFQGNITKQPIYRTTPSGVRICELVVAVNNEFCGVKASYIPCIVWNEDAEIAKSLQVGTAISGVGRLQSREYNKLTNNSSKLYTTSELSINSFEILNNEVCINE